MLVIHWQDNQEGQAVRPTQSHRVGGEGSEVGMKLIEEVKLIGLASNGLGKEQEIPPAPSDSLAGIFETNSGAGHCEG